MLWSNLRLRMSLLFLAELCCSVLQWPSFCLSVCSFSLGWRLPFVWGKENSLLCFASSSPPGQGSIKGWRRRALVTVIQLLCAALLQQILQWALSWEMDGQKYARSEKTLPTKAPSSICLFHTWCGNEVYFSTNHHKCVFVLFGLLVFASTLEKARANCLSSCPQLHL